MRMPASRSSVSSTSRNGASSPISRKTSPPRSRPVSASGYGSTAIPGIFAPVMCRASAAPLRAARRRASSCPMSRRRPTGSASGAGCRLRSSSTRRCRNRACSAAPMRAYCFGAERRMAGFLARLTDGLAGDLRALTLTGPRANAALRSAIATTLAVLIALALHLDNPWWAGISGVVLVQSDRAATVARSVDRVIGTMAGAAVGYVGAGLAGDHLAFLALAGGCTGFAIYAQERAEHGYAFLLSGITIVLIMFGALAAPGTALDLAFYRGFEILVGVCAACAVDYALAEPATLAAVIPKPG